MIGSGAEREAAGGHSTDGNNIRKRRDGGEACSPEEEGHKKSRSLDEFHHHDELCKKFQLVFSYKGGSSHDDDGHRCYQPTFLNQFYPECESALAALAVVRSITLRVSLKSFRILISPEWEDGGEQLSNAVLDKLLQPLISKFPKGFSLPPSLCVIKEFPDHLLVCRLDTFFFAQDQFDRAEEGTVPLIGRGAPLEETKSPILYTTVCRQLTEETRSN